MGLVVRKMQNMCKRIPPQEGLGTVQIFFFVSYYEKKLSDVFLPWYNYFKENSLDEAEEQPVLCLLWQTKLSVMFALNMISPSSVEENNTSVFKVS